MVICTFHITLKSFSAISLSHFLKLASQRITSFHLLFFHLTFCYKRNTPIRPKSQYNLRRSEFCTHDSLWDPQHSLIKQHFKFLNFFLYGFRQRLEFYAIKRGVLHFGGLEIFWLKPFNPPIVTNTTWRKRSTPLGFTIHGRFS